MNYSKELYNDILIYGKNVLDAFNENDWRMFNYLIDLYWLKFGENLRLSNFLVENVIRRYNEIHGEQAEIME